MLLISLFDCLKIEFRREVLTIPLSYLDKDLSSEGNPGQTIDYTKKEATREIFLSFQELLIKGCLADLFRIGIQKPAALNAAG
jgi:hypothetical protein